MQILMAVNLQHDCKNSKFYGILPKVVYPIVMPGTICIVYPFTDIYGFYGCKFMAVNANFYGRRIKAWH
jgi:hypothetical protein